MAKGRHCQRFVIFHSNHSSTIYTKFEMLLSLLKLGTSVPKFPVRFSCRIATALRKADIIPDVICTEPKHKAIVRYKNAEADLGNEITPECTEWSPKVVWKNPQGYFLIIMLDPDMESRQCPGFRHWAQWIIGNVKNGRLKTADTVLKYVGAAPADGTGYHRIVLLVYQQETKINFFPTHVCTNPFVKRENFDLNAFRRKHKLGDPVAVNFFYAKADFYSKRLRKHLIKPCLEK